MKDEIRKFIIETFMYGEGEIKEDDALFESGILDSLGLIKLLTFIENTYNVTIDMKEVTMEKFATINHISDMIKLKQNT